MSSVQKRVLPVTAVFAIFGSLQLPAASAEDTGLYVGGNYLYTLATYRRADVDAGLVSGFSAAGVGLTLPSSAISHGHSTWSADIGYAASRYVAVEASYLDLGTLSYRASGTETSFFGSSPVTAAVTVKSRGPALALIGILPIVDQWQVNARIGAYEGKTSSTVATMVGTNPGTESLSKTSTSVVLGAGTAYSFLGHWSLRLDYVHLNHLSEPVLRKSFNVDLASAGISYAF